MSPADPLTALRATLATLLPPGTAAWVSHDAGSDSGPAVIQLTGALTGHVDRVTNATAPAAHATREAAWLDPDAKVWLDPLWPEELPATAPMRPARLREFRHGRHCARRALAALGQPPLAIPVGPGRAPCWPRGVVGSISHAGPWALAATAPGTRLQALGVDLEPATPLDAALEPMIATPAEYRWLAGVLPQAPGKLAFSAKESVYKCLWPVTGRFLEFREIKLLPGVERGKFRVSFRGSGGMPQAALVEGRMGVAAGFILTAAWLLPR